MPSSLGANALRGHMVVCGDNALTQRVCMELAGVYGQHVTVVLPSLRGGAHGPRIAELAASPRLSVDAVEAQAPDDDALLSAGIQHASALALTSGDDQLNIYTALRARRLNPRLRLVIRMYNRTLGGYLEDLLDRAAKARAEREGESTDEGDATTTVLSDVDTAAPSLVAAAVVGSDKVLYADGLLLRSKERTVGAVSGRDPLCMLALLPGAEDSEGMAMDEPGGPVLLPGLEDLEGVSPERGAVVLEAITRRPRSTMPRRTPRLPRWLALKQLFSRRLRYSLLTMSVLMLVLASLNWLLSKETPLHAVYLTLLDVFAINDPDVGKPVAEQVLQLLAALVGMGTLPLLLAVVLESYGAFRRAASLPLPPRGVSGHVVLLGLGKVGTRVLDRLLELDIPVVCVERDPEARGIALARRRRVPTIIADVTEEGVLAEAKIERSRALLALTSSDGTNLEASLNARQLKPRLRLVMRLFDDDFASIVYRTLRDTYPEAQSRSHSVSALAAPAFAGAMMGRQVLGAIPVGRRVLVFATVEVRGNPLLEGRTVADAAHRGAWRVVALDVASEADRRTDLSSVTSTGASELEWRLHPGYVLKAGDRTVVAATRRGLSDLLAAGPQTRGLPRVPATEELRLPRALRMQMQARRTAPPTAPSTAPTGEPETLGDFTSRPIPLGLPREEGAETLGDLTSRPIPLGLPREDPEQPRPPARGE